MIHHSDVYKIGTITKAHGLRGEVVFNFTDDIFDTVDADYLILEVDGILVPFFIEEYRWRSDGHVLLKLCDIDTQERARELTGCDVFFPHKLAPDNEDYVSWAQIIGFSLQDSESGKTVGIIRNVDDTTINLLFEVETPEGEEVLIPANNDLIDDIDPAKRTLRMRVPNGLLD
jgi:16S rRNA processing protein RimM